MRFRLFITLTLALSAFAQNHPPTPGTGINFYSIDKEIALGSQLAEAVRRESKVLDSDLVQAYVARLGRQLALHAAGPSFPYAFTVIAEFPWSNNDDATYEPMALPGGAIFIPANLILEAQNTAELAGMMAHAIAHAADRDCTRSRTRADLMQLGAISGPQSSACWAGQVVPISYVSFQQAFERQADYFAVQITAKAGYDPAALAAYIQRMQPPPRRQGSISRSFSPWPAVDERVKQIAKEIGKLPPGHSFSAGEDIEPIQAAIRTLPVK